MLKILYVSAAAERGGLEVVLLNTLKCLDRSRFTPQVLFLEDGPFVQEVEETGTEVHLIKSGQVRNVLKGARAITRAVTLIKREGIHLVHSHNAKAHVYGGLAAAIAGIPCLYHLHGVPRPSLSRDGVVSLLSVVVPAQRLLACSQYVADAFKHVWRSAREVLVIHNGVLIEPVATPHGAPTIREEFGISDSAPLVTMACRLQRWKGVHVFLDAAARVVSAYPEVRFMVVGGTLFGLEKGYATHLRDQADRLGLAGSVVFTGYRSDVYRFLAAADLVVHSSIAPDSFPTVIVEAMTLGKPVVASDLGGSRESLEDSVTGLLVSPNQPELLAQAILMLLADPERRSKMGTVGAARARAHFHAERMVQQLETVYERVIRAALDDAR